MGLKTKSDMDIQNLNLRKQKAEEDEEIIAIDVNYKPRST